MELAELDEIAVEDQGGDFWDVYVPLFPGHDRGEYWDTVGRADLISAQRAGVEVYERRTGRLYETP